jgi:hypothetical protein
MATAPLTEILPTMQAVNPALRLITGLLVMALALLAVLARLRMKITAILLKWT